MAGNHLRIASRATELVARRPHDVAVFGGALVEQVMKVDALPAPKQANVMFSAMQILPGGSGGNTAIYLSRLGQRVVLLDKWGRDEHAEMLIEALRVAKVNTSYCRLVPGVPTTYMIILTLPNHDWSGIIRSPDALIIAETDIEEASISSSAILHFHGFCAMTEAGLRGVKRAMQLARESDVILSMDTSTPMAMSKPKALQELLEGCDIVFANSTELLHMYPGKEYDEAAGDILEFAPEAVVVKAGADGCHFFTSNEQGHVPARGVDIVDTIGAGDGVVAGTLSGLVCGLPLLDSVRRGVMVASLVCRGMGGQGYCFDIQDVETLSHKATP